MTATARFRAALAALFAGALLVVAGASPVRAAASAWLDHNQVQLRLIAVEDTVGEGGSLSLGLQFELEPGWKIYWRSPGDAGFPPTIDWSGSENLASATMKWPVPHRFSLFGLETFGYGDAVVLPIDVTLERPGEPLDLKAKVRYLVCEEICIPYDGELALRLEAGPGEISAQALLIDRYQALVPGDGVGVGLFLETAFLIEGDEAPLLEVAARSTTPFEAPDLLVEAPLGFTFGKPEVEFEDDGKRAILRLQSNRGPRAKGVIEGKRLTLTVTDGQRGLETEVVSRYRGKAEVSGLWASLSGSSLLTMLGLAVLGGLILNLMPCVLPVLSIKLLSVVSQGGRDRGKVRIGFLASAAGIIFSFLVLAGIALALKASGLVAGWGIQFQQPLFLTAMAVVVTLFAYNLFGFFQIVLSGRLAALGLFGGGHGEQEQTIGGHFSTGAFATLLATPCSAPFLGTAVGFALSRGPVEILLIFTALGVGLALPYLVVAAVPSLATRLPKPGPWMVVLRRVLGFALLATALWLLSVLARQAGTTAAVLTGVILLAMALPFLGRRLLPAPVLTPLVAVVALFAFLVPVGFAAPAAERPAEPLAGVWQPFDEARIASLVAEGNVVLVDVTAEWCITCLVNKRLVLDRDSVTSRLEGDKMLAMQADWTLPDDAISAYLASFERYGIPFNAVYGPGVPEGETLPEILTIDRVLEALDRAAGG